MKGTTRSDGGEIVQVEGGHILRSTSRKDRHSKVYTAKGPRDRRVRLSAHTAIQFYDVQDRLGYDRPSKAVDWLINKAKTAIDKLNDGSNPSSQLHHGHTTETLSGYALIQPPNNTTSHDNNPTAVSSFSGFSNNAAVLARSHHHLHQFDGQNLGLSLHPFQENFQRMEGYFMNNQSNSSSQGMINSLFSAQGELLQSNLDHTSMDDQHSNDRGRPSWDFGNPFELGFRVPAGIYGDDDDDDHQQQIRRG